MTTEQDLAKTGAAEAPGTGNPIQIAESLADKLWRTTETWNDFAKTTMGIPLVRAMDEIGLHLRLTLGRTAVKQHLQHIENARRALIPVDYFLQRSHTRGLIEAEQAEQLRSQMIDLAQRLDQHRASIIEATNQKIAEQKQQQEKKAKAASTDGKANVKSETTVAH